MKKFIPLFSLVWFLHSLVYGTTYYSQGSLPPELLTSWNDIRTGGGNFPANFSSGDVFVVQNGHSMSGSASWSISGAGSGLWIENGGVITADYPVTLAKSTSFHIDNGGTFIHNNTGVPSSTIFNGTEVFCPNSTFWIKNWIGNLYVIPFGITWGNLIIDVPALNGSWNQVGNITTVYGVLDIRQTGGNANEFRLCSRNTNTYTFNLANISVSGGILSIQGGGTSGTPSMNTNVSGNITLTGGKFDLGTNGTSTINVSGNINISGSGFMTNSGVTSKVIFNRTGMQTISVTEGAMNATMINVDVNPGSTVNMTSLWALSPLATLNIYGILNTNNFTLKPRVVNVGGVLNLGTGELDQLGTGAIMVGGLTAGNTGVINCSGIITMAASAFASFLIQPGGTVNLDNGIINMNHNLATFFVDSAGILNCGTGKIASINSTTSKFILNPSGTLIIGSSGGISLGGPTGNIQVGGERSYHFAANYRYSGAGGQVTGNGLPSMVNDLWINNPSGVALSNNVKINGCLHLLAGFVISSGKVLSYGDSGGLEYDGSQYSTTSDIEFPSSNGPKSLTIDNAADNGIALHASRFLSGSLSISANKKFVIPSAINLSVSGVTTLYGNECLEIRSGASFIDDGFPSSGTGTAIVERSLSAGGWHYVSSPIQEGVAGTFMGDYLNPYDEGTLGFGTCITSPNASLVPGQGYAVWPSSDHTASFTGRLNSGTVETHINRTYTGQSGPDEYDGWNLAGNPYPSSADLDSVFAASENAEATAYFWDQSPMGSGNYLVYPSLTGYGTHSKYVPAMQGFFVHCNASATHDIPGQGIIRFGNNCKVHSSVEFLKKEKKIVNSLFLRVTGSGNTYSDKILVHFDPTSTKEFDDGYDAFKLWGLADAPQLYAISAGEIPLSVTILPFERNKIDIPVGFKTENPGIYFLVADSTGTFGDTISLLLEDLRLGIIQNLKTNPAYTFLYSTGDPADRFRLHFINSGLSARHADPGEGIKICTDRGDVLIYNASCESFSGEVLLFDLTGREVFHSAWSGEYVSRFKPRLEQGVYIISVDSGLRKICRKVYLSGNN